MPSLKSYKERKEQCEIPNIIDEAGKTIGYPRYYIGLSGLGNKCLRSLWFTFRWAVKGELPGRTNRIFRTGHLAEETMVEDLRSIGIECWNVLDDQDEFIDLHGYAKGHPDGYAKNIPGSEKTIHLLEFKTMNEKAFNDVVKNKVKVSKPVYYAQMCLYMYKKKLSRALFMAVNKNNSSYYTERIHANHTYAKELLKRGEEILFSEDFNDFPRIGNNSPSWYECKWCGYKGICFGEKDLVEKNCRTCTNCDLVGEGRFACSTRDNKILELDEQEKGCSTHNLLECFKK